MNRGLTIQVMLWGGAAGENTAFSDIQVTVSGTAGRLFGQPAVSLSRVSGPPTTKILVSGSGFKPNVGVDIFFDTKDKALVVTNGNGEFAAAEIHAPRSAHPGEHWITALERNNDKGAQAPFLVRTDWREFHFDADGTRLNPYENVLNVNNVGSLGLLWSYRTRNPVPCSPVVADGVVYVATESENVDRGWLSAVNADTGAELWAFRTGPVDTSPAVANGVVYVATENEQLFALDARTGALSWIYRSSGDSWPAVANGVVYDANEDGSLYALDASTGALLWTALTYPLSSAPALSNGVVYVVSEVAWALKSSTGSVVWSYDNNHSYDGGSSPVVANGIVYFGLGHQSGGGALDALSASTGAVLWSYTTGGSVSSSPAVANGVVYVGSDDENVYALNASTGALLWSYATGGFVSSSPAVANGVVYVGSLDGNVYALNAQTGVLLWKYNTGNVYSSPVVANGVMYVGSLGGNLYAFGLPRGDQTKEDAASKRPDLKMLHPDFSLKVSKPVTTASGAQL